MAGYTYEIECRPSIDPNSHQSVTEILALRAGVRLVPSLITTYFKLLKGMMLFLVVLILGRNLASYEASVRYPEGHFQDHSEKWLLETLTKSSHFTRSA